MAVACAMLMPAVLLTTSCSKGDDAVTNPEKPANTETAVNKGYALPVTVNVTRQDDGTRATYNESTKKLEFSTGDKLFVYGSATSAGSFAGELTWQSGGTFSGTIYTQNEYSGTADALFSAATSISATLLPNGYESYNFLSISGRGTSEKYDDEAVVNLYKAFVASETAKAKGVEQFSFEKASNYSSGFALTPQCAILNFTISGLEAGAQDVILYVKITDGPDTFVKGSVTPNASGVATFAIGVPGGFKISDMANNLTVGSSNFTLPGGTTLTAGKIYNITRGTGATVDLSTKSVDYTAQNGETLTGTLASNVKISIADDATVILNNVTITGTNSNSYPWAGISCEGDATIILSGTNTVKGFYENYPGIHVPTGKTLTINGTGSLTASSNGYSAGIGGGVNNSCGNIVINSGNITATGGVGAAGIGGRNASCGNITISGGNITATGGEDGVGIGSGYDSTCGNIEISGGTITATGGNYGAGIGSGYRGTCGYITISGGTITATGSGSQGGAGIGSGTNGSCGNINITSGVTQVTATKGSGANSIGAGPGGSCGTVTIDGTVYAGGITDSPYIYQP